MVSMANTIDFRSDWTVRGSGHSGSSGGTSSGESRGSQYFSYGGLSFSLDFNWTTAIVKLLDREFSLATRI